MIMRSMFIISILWHAYNLPKNARHSWESHRNPRPAYACSQWLHPLLNSSWYDYHDKRAPKTNTLISRNGTRKQTVVCSHHARRRRRLVEIKEWSCFQCEWIFQRLQKRACGTKHESKVTGSVDWSCFLLGNEILLHGREWLEIYIEWLCMLKLCWLCMLKLYLYIYVQYIIQYYYFTVLLCLKYAVMCFLVW